MCMKQDSEFRHWGCREIHIGCPRTVRRCCFEVNKSPGRACIPARCINVCKTEDTNSHEWQDGKENPLLDHRAVCDPVLRLTLEHSIAWSYGGTQFTTTTATTL